MIAVLDLLFPVVTSAALAARWSAYRHHLTDYMLRYIIQTPIGTLRLHRICRSDMHDHPWHFASFLLTGGYYEEVPAGLMVCGKPGCCTTIVKRSPWSIVRHRADDLHRLIVPSPIWTLVVTGPKLRRWGFMTEAGWVYWREYLGIHGTKQQGEAS